MKRKHTRKALKIILAIIIVWLVSTFLTVNTIYSLSFTRNTDAAWSLKDEQLGDYATTFMTDGTSLLDLGAEPCSFISSGNTLFGYLLEVEHPLGLVVIVHGIHGNANELSRVASALLLRGWDVFAYDASGCGRSGGSSCKSLAQSALDLDKALDFVEKKSSISSLPIVLLGHSWGGYAVAAVCALGHNIAAVASFSGYNSIMTMTWTATKSLLKGASFIFYPMTLAYSFAMNGSYLNLSALDGIESATDTKFLIVHGEDDSFVTYDGASIYQAVSSLSLPNVSLLSLYGRDHFNVFLSDDAVALQATYRETLRTYITSRGGEITEEEFNNFLAICDLESANALDNDLIDRVDSFFREALA